jgi:hypothetical protein
VIERVRHLQRECVVRRDVKQFVQACLHAHEVVVECRLQCSDVQTLTRACRQCGGKRHMRARAAYLGRVTPAHTLPCKQDMRHRETWRQRQRLGSWFLGKITPVEEGFGSAFVVRQCSRCRAAERVAAAIGQGEHRSGRARAARQRPGGRRCHGRVHAEGLAPSHLANEGEGVIGMASKGRAEA